MKTLQIDKAAPHWQDHANLQQTLDHGRCSVHLQNGAAKNTPVWKGTESPSPTAALSALFSWPACIQQKSRTCNAHLPDDRL